MSAAEPPAGVARLLKRRERRVSATWLLGHDPTVPPVPRMLARALSGYERATIRGLVMALLQEVPIVDQPILWAARRAIFALAGRPRGDEDPTLDFVVPGSGWAGNLLAVAVWASLIGAVVWLVPGLG